MLYHKLLGLPKIISKFKDKLCFHPHYSAHAISEAIKDGITLPDTLVCLKDNIVEVETSDKGYPIKILFRKKL